jgi:uncharacterized membrane protein (UPF0127 family)
MFFVFGSRGQHRFWMKGMTFALDMLWLDASPADDGSLIVVHIAEDVAPDPVGTPDGARPTYGPAVPASFVLEVNAGWAASRGITPGSVAIVSHDPSLRPGRGEAVGAYAQNEGLPPLSHP